MTIALTETSIWGSEIDITDVWKAVQMHLDQWESTSSQGEEPTIEDLRRRIELLEEDVDDPFARVGIGPLMGRLAYARFGWSPPSPSPNGKLPLASYSHGLAQELSAISVPRTREAFAGSLCLLAHGANTPTTGTFWGKKIEVLPTSHPETVLAAIPPRSSS